ncbi:MAG: domain S-box [Firmicutes bacterium]|nr:domain S-box [Bacillota bacterium]
MYEDGIMPYNFSDLVDISKLNKLMQRFYQATGIPSGILDVKGTILVAIGWQDICKNFHLKNASSKKLCKQSHDCIPARLANHMNTKPYLCYKCPNGLFDAVAPIIIDGVHVANIFQGQFLFEKPDIDYFIRQAERHGFDKKAYLAALDRVPIYTQKKLDDIMYFSVEFAEMLADLALPRLRQIEQQKQALQRSDEQIFLIFNNMANVAIQAYDEYGNITFWNKASEELYGFKQADVIGHSSKEILFDNEYTDLLVILNKINLTNSLHGPAEWKIKNKNGNDKYVYATLFPISLSTGKKEFICIDIDITEQKHFSKELERLDRLSLVGEMAAGLAHEIRNPMTTVRGYLQLLRSKQCYQEHVNQYDLMIEELDCANKIITEYLSLAKNKSLKKEIHNLNQIINALLPLLSLEAARESKIIRWLPGDIQTLLLDKNEIRQLVINLVRNALDAVDHGGIIEICTLMDYQTIVLQVQDNGKGIPEEILDKLGTPFVTTKENGTGLGLAVCFSIAARHNARLLIQSNTLGTSVSVKFIR